MTAPKPLPYTAEQFMARARSFIGTKESPRGSNRQRFGALYAARKHGQNGVAWCGQLVWGVHAALGVDLIADGYGVTNAQYTPRFWRDLRDKARWQRVNPKDIQAGDHVFLDFPDGFRTGDSQHVVLADGKVRNGQFKTVEGNTSSGSTGSQDNGDGVYPRYRKTAHVVAAFRPPFARKAAPVKKATTATVSAALVLATGALVYNGKTYTTGPAPRVTVTKTVTARPTTTAKPQAPAPRPTVKVVPKPPAPPARPKPVFVKVRRGDSLTAIGKRNHTDWKTLARLNKLRSPYTIRPGQQLRVR